MRVCTRCFADTDLKRYIRKFFLHDAGLDEPDRDRLGFVDWLPGLSVDEFISKESVPEALDSWPRDIAEELREELGVCDYCDERDVPTAEFEDVAEYIRSRISIFYDDANNWLPWSSADGGFQGIHWDSFDLLTDEITLFSDTSDTLLLHHLVDSLEETVWCERDPWALPLDRELVYSWSRFCAFVKHERRFFFHTIGEGAEFDEVKTFLDLLVDLGGLLDEFELVKLWKAGHAVFRARSSDAGNPYRAPSDLGPPPADRAIVSNRMSPPGVPIVYAADSPEVADAEIDRPRCVSIGTFSIERDILVLDLARLPPRQGIFSEVSGREILGLRFLHEFAETISQPIARDDRTHIEYIPTQILTEFVRDFAFKSGKISGISYRSSVLPTGANIVLFASQRDVFGGLNSEDYVHDKPIPWLRLVDVQVIER